MNEPKQHDARTDEIPRTAHETRHTGAHTTSTDVGAKADSAHEGNRMHATGASTQGGAASGGSMSGMQRVEEIGAGTARAGRNMVQGAVSTTEQLGTGIVGGATHIATDLVHGVTDLGYEIRNGATGLIGAAGDIGSAAVNTVAGLLVDVVGGVRQVVNTAVHGHPDGGAHAGQSMQSRPYPEQDTAPTVTSAKEELRH